MIFYDDDPLYLAIAASDLGKKERGNDAPWLREMLARLGLSWLVGQPWCGSIMADWMRKAGISPPAQPFRAKSWMNWGVPSKLVRGAVVVLAREGGGHVGIVVGASKDRISVLGGNQGDAVSIASFSQDRVLGYRVLPGSNLSRLPDLQSDASQKEE